jgi:hypothetical protein
MGKVYDETIRDLNGRWSSRQSLRGGGYSYQINSYQNSDGDFFMLNIEIVNGVSTAIIKRSPKTTLYEYDLNGATAGYQIPTGLKDRIASDFEAVGEEYAAEQAADTRTDEEKYIDSVLAEEARTGGSGAVVQPYEYTLIDSEVFPPLTDSQGELVGGAMQEVEYRLLRGVGARSEQGVMVETIQYKVEVYIGGELRGSPYTRTFDNQVDAEAYFSDAVDETTRTRASLAEQAEQPDPITEVMNYRGITVKYFAFDPPFYRIYDGEDLLATFYIDGTNIAGREGEENTQVVLVGDETDEDRLKQIINARLDGRVVERNYEVRTWEYYMDNIGASDNPFEYLDVYGQIVQQDSGFTMKLNDVDVDIFGTRASSGAVRMRVRNGYEATLRIATENFAYWVYNIDGLRTTGEGLTGSFVNPHPQIVGISIGGGATQVLTGGELDVVQITLKGGDLIHIDVDDDFTGIADLKIEIDGKNYATDAKNINDEVYIVMESVYYSDDNLFDDYEEQNPQDVQPDDNREDDDDNGDGEGGDEGGFKLDGRTILIAGGIIIGFAVIASVISRSGE